MDTEITTFSIDLYDDVLALWQQCEGVGLSDADSRDSIQAYLTRNPGMSFVATADSKVVGAILAGHDGRRGYIHHLAVHPSCRRHGLGRKLVDRAISVLRSAGIQKAHIFIFNSNATGIAFWESVGWIPRNDIGVISKTIEPSVAGDA
jgi:ribosomal protein S18 acetylase RimI-like enzyme